MSRRIGSALLLLWTMFPGEGWAQTCFRSAPAPTCSSLFLLEFGYSRRLNADSTATGGLPQTDYLVGELGLLRNLSPRWSAGGTLGAEALVSYAFQVRPVLQGRLRYWASPRIGLDLGAGFLVGSVPQDTAFASPTTSKLGLSTRLGLSLEDKLSLVGQLEYLPSPTDADLTFLLGGRVGSAVGLWAGLAAGALLGLGCALAC